MKKVLTILGTVTVTVIFGLTFWACDGAGLGGEDTATLKLSLTDAPIDDSDVTGVYLTIESIEYNRNGEWETFENFTPNNPYNLLELTGGESSLLGELVLPSGTYQQIRFMLQAAEQGQQAGSTVGTWINRDNNATYDEGTDNELYVPSGGKTGYKAEAGDPFDVAENQTVSVTADWDVRRSVVKAGKSGMYILKPVLRLVVDNKAATLTGTVSSMGVDVNANSYQYGIFVYEDDTYTDTEDDDPADGEARFPNAVSGATVLDENGDSQEAYTIAYLGAGTYDVYVARYLYNTTEGAYEFDQVLMSETIQDVTLESGSTVTQDIDLSS